MIERIIFCAISCSLALTDRPHTELYDAQDGKAVAVSDNVLLDLYAHNNIIEFLYFSRASFEKAIHKLSSSEIKKAIEERRSSWTPQAPEYILSWVYINQRKSLTLIARTDLGSLSQKPSIFEKYFNDSVGFLSNLIGEDRYDDVSLSELLVFLLEQEAFLISELQSTTVGNPSLFSEEIQEGKKLMAFLGNTLVKYGHPEYESSIPYSEVIRGVNISPVDDSLLNWLKMESISFTPWKDGVVCRLSSRQLKLFEKQGKAIQLIYYSGDEFTEELMKLTTEQLHISMAERLNEVSNIQVKNEYLNELRLDVLLLMKTVLIRSKNENPELYKSLEQNFKSLKLQLMSQLSSDGSWLPEKIPLGNSALQTLLELQENVVKDITLFKELTVRSGRDDLNKRMHNLESMAQMLLNELFTINNNKAIKFK